MTSARNPGGAPSRGTPRRKLGARAGAWLGGLALLLVLAAVALVSEFFLHGRVDLTRDRQFTLSRAAVKTLEGLPDVVTARVVMSRELPSQFQQIRTRAMDLLREFEARSDGKFVIVLEDPRDDEERRAAVEAMGIQEVQLQEESREGMEVKRGYFGLALLFGDRKEVFPVVENLENLEYDLIVRLMRLTGAQRTVGIVEGAPGNRRSFALPGEAPLYGFAGLYPTLRATLERTYRVTDQRPDLEPVADDVDVLLVAAPSFLDEVEKFRIDQFLMSGKPVIFMAPGMNVNVTENITAQPSVNGYEDLLAHYGVGVRKNVVLEARSWEAVRFENSRQPRPYPYWIVATYNTMNPSNPVTATLQSLSLPWTASLEIDTAAQPHARIEPLVLSTPEAWEETGPLAMNPRSLSEYRPGEPAMFPLAALAAGTFASRYAGAVPDGVPAPEAAAALEESKAESRLIVIPNALFVSDFYVSYTRAVGNFHFLLNAVDYLALDPDLIDVRSRQLDGAPLDEEKVARLKTPVILANLLLAPLLLALAGGIAAMRRRARAATADGGRGG